MIKWNVDTEQMMEFPFEVEADDALTACCVYVEQHQENVHAGPQRLFVAARKDDGLSDRPMLEVRCTVFEKADGTRFIAAGRTWPTPRRRSPITGPKRSPTGRGASTPTA